MRFESPLIRATLLRRYKRFLADVRREDGSVQTIHCPNTGAMTGCDSPGSEIWCSVSGNPARKYPLSLEIVRAGEHLVAVNPQRANTVVREAMLMRQLDEFSMYAEVHAEVRSPDGESRLDLGLYSDGQPDCYVEIKSMTFLGEEGRGYFPDARSDRATKHVHSLVAARAAGKRAALVFCVLHSGIRCASIAGWIDPVYSAAVRAAQGQGVEIHAYSARISPEGIWLESRLPFLS